MWPYLAIVSLQMINWDEVIAMGPNLTGIHIKGRNLGIDRYVRGKTWRHRENAFFMARNIWWYKKLGERQGTDLSLAAFWRKPLDDSQILNFQSQELWYNKILCLSHSGCQFVALCYCSPSKQIHCLICNVLKIIIYPPKHTQFFLFTSRIINPVLTSIYGPEVE